MPDSPDCDARGVNTWERAGIQYRVMIVLGLLERIYGVAWDSVAGSPAAMVVDEDCVAGGLEAEAPGGYVVFF